MNVEVIHVNTQGIRQIVKLFEKNVWDYVEKKKKSRLYIYIAYILFFIFKIYEQGLRPIHS